MTRRTITVIVLTLLASVGLATAWGIYAASAPLGGCGSVGVSTSFAVSPGGVHSFKLPVTQCPIDIEVSMTLANGGTLTPSEVIHAVVNQDPVSKNITWIGTNNDATTAAGTTLNTKTIASFFGGARPTVDASLLVANAAANTLEISQSAATTARPGRYVVTMRF